MRHNLMTLPRRGRTFVEKAIARLTHDLGEVTHDDGIHF